MHPDRRVSFVLLGLLGCATPGIRPGAQVVADAPAECRPIGRVAVREVPGILVPREMLVASATEEIRVRATERGASHVLVASTGTGAMVGWSTAATVEGLALACPLPR